MLCPWPLLTVLVTASLASSAPLARRGGSTDQSQQVSGTSDGSIHPISVDGSQQIVNTFSKPPEIPSAVNNAPDPVGLAWVLGHMDQGQGQGQGAGAGASGASSSPSPVNNRREVPPIGAMIEPLMDGLGMAGMMGGMGGGGGGGGGGSTDQSQQSSGNADDSYHPISVNSGQKVQNNFRRSPLGFGTLGKTPSAPPPPPSSSAPPPPSSSAPAPPPSSTPAPPPSSSTTASAPSTSSTVVSDPTTSDRGPELMKGTPRIGTTIPNSGASSDGPSKSQEGNDDDGGSGSGGGGPKIHAGGHANVSISGSDNNNSTNLKGVANSTVITGSDDRVCYLPSYEGERASYTTNSVYENDVNTQNATQGSKKDQQQVVSGSQDQHKSGGQQNGGKGNSQNNRRAVFARGGGGGGECGNCVCNCDCSPNRRSVNVTPSSLYSLYERRGATKKVVTPANCAVVKSQGGLVYSGDQCHLKGQPAKVSG